MNLTPYFPQSVSFTNRILPYIGVFQNLTPAFGDGEYCTIIARPVLPIFFFFGVCVCVCVCVCVALFIFKMGTASNKTHQFKTERSETLFYVQLITLTYAAKSTEGKRNRNEFVGLKCKYMCVV